MVARSHLTFALISFTLITIYKKPPPWMVLWKVALVLSLYTLLFSHIRVALVADVVDFDGHVLG